MSSSRSCSAASSTCTPASGCSTSPRGVATPRSPPRGVAHRSPPRRARPDAPAARARHAARATQPRPRWHVCRRRRLPASGRRSGKVTPDRAARGTRARAVGSALLQSRSATVAAMAVAARKRLRGSDRRPGCATSQRVHLAVSARRLGGLCGRTNRSTMALEFPEVRWYYMCEALWLDPADATGRPHGRTRSRRRSARGPSTRRPPNFITQDEGRHACAAHTEMRSSSSWLR